MVWYGGCVQREGVRFGAGEASKQAWVTVGVCV